MPAANVHFEVFIRRFPDSNWTLKTATESRTAALDEANEIMAKNQAAAVRVLRETLDPATGEYASLTILNLGLPERPRKVRAPEPTEPLCVSPQDLYTCHARDRLGRLFESWLDRHEVTAWELLHRPDLVEQLEASGVEITQAIQKIAIPEAHSRGASIGEMTQTFKSLGERAIERLMKDARKGLPQVTPETFEKTAAGLSKDPEGVYRLGCAVAGHLASAQSWSEKVGLLLDLADKAPEGPGRSLAFAVLAEPLEEIVRHEKGLDNVVGGALDLGARLAAMTRLCAADVVDQLVKVEPSVAKVMPELAPRAQRLAKWLPSEAFTSVRSAIGRRILRDLSGQRRLRPSDPMGEIDAIRGLAMSLTAASGKLLPLENVQEAVTARSKMLVARDFVEVYLGEEMSAEEEALALVWLTENVIGPANKREAGRWLASLVTSLRFERETRETHNPGKRMAGLAKLQKGAARCGLIEEIYKPIQLKVGELGGLLEADSRLIATTVRAPSPALQRLTALLKLACGETGPLGPVSERARVEAMKLARTPDTRAELAAMPEQVDAIRDLLKHLGRGGPATAPQQGAQPPEAQDHQRPALRLRDAAGLGVVGQEVEPGRRGDPEGRRRRLAGPGQEAGPVELQFEGGARFRAADRPVLGREDRVAVQGLQQLQAQDDLRRLAHDEVLGELQGAGRRRSGQGEERIEVAAERDAADVLGGIAGHPADRAGAGPHGEVDLAGQQAGVAPQEAEVGRHGPRQAEGLVQGDGVAVLEALARLHRHHVGDLGQALDGLGLRLAAHRQQRGAADRDLEVRAARRLQVALPAGGGRQRVGEGGRGGQAERDVDRPRDARTVERGLAALALAWAGGAAEDLGDGVVLVGARPEDRSRGARRRREPGRRHQGEHEDGRAVTARSVRN